MPHKRAADYSAEDRADIIRQLEFGAGLSDTLLMRFAARSTIVDCRRRRFIYREGDPADSLYIIARGRIKLCRVGKDAAREAVIDIISTGSLFGESALYATGSRKNCAVAYENSRLLRIPSSEFQVGMAEDRELYDYTFRLIGQRLSCAEQRVADFALNAIPARLERLLIDLSKRYGVSNNSGGVLIDLPLPHREIASIVGSTRESVTVRLNHMRRQGTIDFVNRKILIKHPELLSVA
jgi:CRP-like cAMP-binding protein